MYHENHVIFVSRLVWYKRSLQVSYVYLYISLYDIWAPFWWNKGDMTPTEIIYIRHDFGVRPTKLYELRFFISKKTPEWKRRQLFNMQIRTTITNLAYFCDITEFVAA